MAFFLHNIEEHYLWSIIAYKLEALFSLSDDVSYQERIFFEQFEVHISVAAGNYFLKMPSLSPAELDRAAWDKLLLRSDIFTEREKNTLQMFVNGTVFNKFKHSFEVKLTNITEPVTVEKYLLALEAWVNSKKYRRQENYAYEKITLPSKLKIFSSIDDFLTREKLR